MYPSANPCPSTLAPSTLALTIEFVAKPEKAAGARMFLPEAVHGALKEVAGFAGCVVLSADQESRLITVITFWAGNDSRKRCHQNTRWVKALVASYADRCLRVQTMLACAPAEARISAGNPVENVTETIDGEMGSITMQECPAEETFCVA